MQGLRTLEACVKDAAWVKDQRVPPGGPLVPRPAQHHSPQLVIYIEIVWDSNGKKKEMGGGQTSCEVVEETAGGARTQQVERVREVAQSCEQHLRREQQH
jgi:hypothetical protein